MANKKTTQTVLPPKQKRLLLPRSPLKRLWLAVLLAVAVISLISAITSWDRGDPAPEAPKQETKEEAIERLNREGPPMPEVLPQTQ